VFNKINIYQLLHIIFGSSLFYFASIRYNLFSFILYTEVLMIKKIVFTTIFTTTFLLAGCNTEETVKMELDTIDKKVSYMFAFGSASQVQDAGITFDVDVVRQAIEDANSGREPRLSIEEMQAAHNAFKLMQLESNED